jgi:hypothetical protein
VITEIPRSAPPFGTVAVGEHDLLQTNEGTVCLVDDFFEQPDDILAPAPD